MEGWWWWKRQKGHARLQIENKADQYKIRVGCTHNHNGLLLGFFINSSFSLVSRPPFSLDGVCSREKRDGRRRRRCDTWGLTRRGSQQRGLMSRNCDDKQPFSASHRGRRPRDLPLLLPPTQGPSFNQPTARFHRWRDEYRWPFIANTLRFLDAAITFWPSITFSLIYLFAHLFYDVKRFVCQIVFFLCQLLLYHGYCWTIYKRVVGIVWLSPKYPSTEKSSRLIGINELLSLGL